MGYIVFVLPLFSEDIAFAHFEKHVRDAVGNASANII